MEEDNLVESNDERAGTYEMFTKREALFRIKNIASDEWMYTPDPDYINNKQKDGMKVEWRNRITEWFQRIRQAYNLDTTTIFKAVNYMDRYLSKYSLDPVNFRLLVLGALFIATKVEELAIPTQHLAYHLSQGAFVPEDIQFMEIEILQCLQYRLHPITPIDYASLLIQLLPSTLTLETIKIRTDDLLSNFVFDYSILKFPASMQAVAAITCVLRILAIPQNYVILWLQELESCSFHYEHLSNASVNIQQCAQKFCNHLLLEQAADQEVERMLSNLGVAPEPSTADGGDTFDNFDNGMSTPPPQEQRPYSDHQDPDRDTPPGDVTLITPMLEDEENRAYNKRKW
eukprot:CAMPEP_0197320050 /NCGR_PEP_ID=MMETSP0891-20130614/57230_1 /TAXON_ID=44058 ORGANISM="Aureoumbra lagunensis, Strain CCMP1510" /NCGR_SAMPLE_ID=MMETSP0891 /ASSEMBLY_ACC=CAM_ASM_000534 /LENGTH=343 /DNA_ID=CAMNT_0042811255 /DNA_START=8 /DNA_END=1036 /DNA_ORIENTATION=-